MNDLGSNPIGWLKRLTARLGRLLGISRPVASEFLACPPEAATGPKPNDLYGWFEPAAAPNSSPAFDPGAHSPCPYCGLPVTGGDARCHVLADVEGRQPQFFFRVHATCDDKAGPGRAQLISAVFARIVADGALTLS